jgi:hypothetical protein
VAGAVEANARVVKRVRERGDVRPRQEEDVLDAARRQRVRQLGRPGARTHRRLPRPHDAAA